MATDTSRIRQASLCDSPVSLAIQPALPDETALRAMPYRLLKENQRRAGHRHRSAGLARPNEDRRNAARQ